MDIIQAILLRKSHRAYVDEPIPSESVNKLNKIIDALNSKSGLNISLISDKSAFGSFKKDYGFFKGVNSYFVLAGKISDALLHEKAGYYGEMLVLEAEMLGLGTCWVGSSYDKASVNVPLGDDEKIVCVIAVGIPLKKQSLREKTIYKVTHLKKKAIEDMYECDINPPPEWFLSGMSAVAAAPSAVNKQPVKIIYRGGKITANTGAFQYNQIDLGIAKLHFDIGCKGMHNFESEYKN